MVHFFTFLGLYKVRILFAIFVVFQDYNIKNLDTMNLKRTLLSLFVMGMASLLYAQPYAYNPYDENEAESCTSIMVGKKASTDGSVMTAHTCDSNYRTWLTM